MKKKILIIEDESEIRENIAAFLTYSDYDVITASNGEDGILLAKETKPNLIISDIMMPDIDGFEVLKQLQMDSETESIPFLFLTAKNDKNSIREAMQLGADDYISKPFDFNDLISSINKRLEKHTKQFAHLNQKIEDLQYNLKHTMPHEIRTPLNIILGLSDFLQKNTESIPNSEVIEMLQNINDSARRLNRLFENYLLYANLEVISRTPDEKSKLLKNRTYFANVLIKDLITTRAHNFEKQLDLKFDLEEANLKITEHLFVKAVDEIIDNSFKFAESETEITVQSTSKKNIHYISFTNYGRGLTKEQIKNIDAYVQFERKIYEQQGSGLGLTIVNKILELHNGHLSINSEQNTFTTVTISIPTL